LSRKQAFAQPLHFLVATGKVKRHTVKRVASIQQNEPDFAHAKGLGMQDPESNAGKEYPAGT
jgi:hypothetical protein